MADEPESADDGLSFPWPGSSLTERDRRRPDALLLRFLIGGEYIVLYVISFVLLLVASGVLVVVLVTVARSSVAWPERFVTVIEELLLVLIVLEIFITVMTHLRGGRLQLEPFIVVGVIAVVRHILSLVVRLAVPGAPPATKDQLVELAVNAGVIFVLVVALALARWSLRRTTSLA